MDRHEADTVVSLRESLDEFVQQWQADGRQWPSDGVLGQKLSLKIAMTERIASQFHRLTGPRFSERYMQGFADELETLVGRLVREGATENAINVWVVVELLVHRFQFKHLLMQK